MIGLENQSFTSSRLRYRLLNAGDRAALRTILSDRSVTEPAGYLPAATEGAFDVFFAELTRYGAGVAVLRGDELIGYIRIYNYKPDQSEYFGKRCASTGLAIGKPYQNQGYGTEALIAITAWLKRRCDFCFASHFKENAPSRRIIEKSGYRRLGEYAMYFDELGREESCVEYVY